MLSATFRRLRSLSQGRTGTFASSLRGDLLDAPQREHLRANHEAPAARPLRDRRVPLHRGQQAVRPAHRDRVVRSIDAGRREAQPCLSSKDGGGTVDSLTQFDARPDLVALGNKLGDGFRLLGTAPSQLRPLGRRLGRALRPRRARVPRPLQAGFPDAFKGDYRGADAVIFYRSGDDRDNNSKTFESAVVQGLRDSGVPVVGVERTETDPSQIPYYVNAGLSTVDDLDIPPGRIALVLTLTGTTGDFGFKKTAEAPLPPAPGASGP